MTTKAKGTSIRQKITGHATKIDVPFQNIQTAFMIERLVARLVADKNLAKHLLFKGGFVGLRVYNSDGRFIRLKPSVQKKSMHWSRTAISTPARKIFTIYQYFCQRPMLPFLVKP